ncbi:MAG: formylglycine-generating enzyme family protein [Pseudomonadota bacterium]
MLTNLKPLFSIIKPLPIFVRCVVVVVVAFYVGGMVEKTVPSSRYYLRIYKPPMPKPTASPNEKGVTCPRDKDLKAGESFQDCLQDSSKGPEMIVIPAGHFEMGNIQGDHDEQNVHSVSVKKFAMCRYEITFEEYDRFTEATHRKPPDDEGWGRGKFPVINVTWHDAKAYMKWLSDQTGQTYRLPSEAQWEYAARATSREHANYDSNKTSQVGSFEKNDFGLYDMLGNVWEWVADPYYENYPGPHENIWKKWQAGDDRVLRGCSWLNPPDICRITNRYSPNDPNRKSANIGFRCSSQITE